MILKKDYELMVEGLKRLIEIENECKGYTPYNNVARKITHAMRSLMEDIGVEFENRDDYYD